MSRGGHNWKGGGTVEGTRSIDVMKMARAGCLVPSQLHSWQWIWRGGSTASVLVTGGHEAIRLDYRMKPAGGDWETVSQCVPIHWSPCRFGGERPWFICNVSSNGVYCGRRVSKLYSGGRLFACRHCYRLGYGVERGGLMDRAHHRLARLHRRLGADYNGPDRAPPPKPKWMRLMTYSRITKQLEAGQEQLDVVFTTGAQRILARTERAKHRSRRRRWTRGLRRPR
jgi:hypothetical protein